MNRWRGHTDEDVPPLGGEEQSNNKQKGDSMSQSLRRSISFSAHRANILAFACGILSATLAASAFGGCPSGKSPVPAEPSVGIPMSFGVLWSGIQFPHRGLNGTVMFDWGDGTASEGNIICSGDPRIQDMVICGAVGRHTYSAVETGIQITVGGGGLCTSAPFDVVAGPPPPGADVLSDPKLMLRRVQATVAVMGVIAAFSDSNPSAVVADFTAVIDWGDGTQSDGVVSSPSPGKLNVSPAFGGHTYATKGSVTVSVSLSAPGVAESTATGMVTVRGGRHR